MKYVLKFIQYNVFGNIIGFYLIYFWTACLYFGNIRVRLKISLDIVAVYYSSMLICYQRQDTFPYFPRVYLNNDTWPKLALEFLVSLWELQSPLSQWGVSRAPQVIVTGGVGLTGGLGAGEGPAERRVVPGVDREGEDKGTLTVHGPCVLIHVDTVGKKWV